MNSKRRAQLTILGCFAAVALLLTWGETYVVLNKALPGLTSWVAVMENHGSVCFDMTGFTTTLRGYLTSQSCFLNSRVYDIQNEGGVTLDRVGHRILAHSRFVLLQFVTQGLLQGGSCGVEQSIPYNLEPVAPGAFTVWLGEQKIGDIVIPFIRSNNIMCFQTKPDAVYKAYNSSYASYPAPYYVAPTYGPPPTTPFPTTTHPPYPFPQPTPIFPPYYPPPAKK